MPILDAYKAVVTARNIGRFAFDAAALYQAPGRATLTRAGGSLAEIVGLDNLVGGLAKFGVRLAFESERADAGTMDEMLALMRTRVPRDTGLLFNGIAGEIEDGVATVSASAIRYSGTGKESADYARFVERGTAGGQRGRKRAVVADARYYDQDAFGNGPARSRPSRRQRISRRDHPGTAPRPFFYNSADEVLAKRNARMEQAAADAADASGLA